MSKVAVLGIGRVGLPLALYLADKGHDVVGVDVNAAHVAKIAAGQVPFVEEGAAEVLTRVLGKRFRPTTEKVLVSEAEVIILTLGTPVDEHLNPDMRAFERLLLDVAPHLRPGQLFILRSTVTPGTLEWTQRRLEAATKLRVGEDLFLAFCPERIAEGKSFVELPQIPQIVGTLDPASQDRAAAFFEGLVSEVLRTDARSAEIAKLFCNVYRYIDFAIGNEFMMIADHHERDIHHIARLVNHGYRRGGLKSPGFTGGPCLYKDGFFLVERTPFPDLLTTAWKINESVPAYLIEGARKRLGSLEGKPVLVLGLAFKKEIDDTRNSLAYKAIKILNRAGAEVMRHDPYLAPGPLEPLLRRAAFVLVATNHDAYARLGRRGLVDAGARGLVADIWNVFGTGEVFFDVGGPEPAERRGAPAR